MHPSSTTWGERDLNAGASAALCVGNCGMWILPESPRKRWVSAEPLGIANVHVI
jgi:hypothetical protein